MKEEVKSTKPWGNPKTAKVMVIGHDPALQRSQTLAEYCFFADYYFRDKPSSVKELRKYQLAEALFTCIDDLTGGRIPKEQILITNLCNHQLTRPGKGKTVFIPRKEAEQGLAQIAYFLADSKIKLVFPMAQQVNYWLQTLGFYPIDRQFIEAAEPDSVGIDSCPAFYRPRKTGAFKYICGKRFTRYNQQSVFPILHIKNYPLKGRFKVYEQAYANCKTEVQRVIESLA